MATDLLRTEGNERLDLIDFDFMANTGLQDLTNEPIANLMTDPAKQKMWVVSGFEISNPAASQLQVDRGAAILATRENGTVKYGYMTTQGEASRTVDLSTYSPGTYSIYIRFDYLDGDTSSRVFWNPAGAGGEFTSNIATRRLANWSVRVELSSPGAEWFKIGEVVQATMTITDQRPFYFEGNIDDSYESGWSSDGGGGPDDRDADRATHGVKDFQTFTAAVRQSITDIRGRGLREWYEKGIGGMNIGFDTDPTENILAVSDTLFALDGSNGNDKYLYFNGNTNCLRFDRPGIELYTRIAGTNEMRVSASGVNITKGLYVGSISSTPTANSIHVSGAGGIGLGTTPVAGRVSIGDANNYHLLSGNFAQWYGNPGCALTYDRVNHTWDMGVDSFSYFTLNVANSGAGVRTCELDLFGLSNFSLISDASDVQWQWDSASYINFDRSGNRLEFDIAGTERFHIDANGCYINGEGIITSGLNVGFSSTPSADSVAVGDADFRMDFNSANPRLYMEGDSYIGLSRASEKVMSFVLDNETFLSLNELTATTWAVEIGKASDQSLDISFDTTANRTIIYSGTNNLRLQTDNDIYLYSGTGASDAIYFGNSAGNNIGAINYPDGFNLGSTAIPSEMLDVVDTVADGWVAHFFNDGNGSGSNYYGIVIQAGADIATGTTEYVTCFDGDASVELGGLRYVSPTGMQVYDTSDERLKRDIQDTKIKGLDIINDLRLIEYRWKRHGDNGDLNPIGFSAQQAQKVFPIMVSQRPGNNSDTLSVSPGALIPVLCKAIQELTARVTQLEGA